MEEFKKICILGIGYAGLHQAMAFAKFGPVMGFDVDAGRIDELQTGFDRYNQYTREELLSSPLLLTHDLAEIQVCNVYILHVPTPLKVGNQPDLEHLKSACRMLGSVLKSGDLVVIESTVYPGVTEQECLPLLEQTSGLVPDMDFSIGYSPQLPHQSDQGQPRKRVLAANDEAALHQMEAVYAEVSPQGMVRASSIQVAEAAKLFENVQQDLHLALVNEFAMMLDRLGVSSYEALDLSQPGPGFAQFRPGFAGGYHLGIDPYYMAFEAERLGHHPQLFAAGRRINDELPRFLAKKAVRLCSAQGWPLYGLVATVLGLSYQAGIADLRNGKCIDFVKELASFGMDLQLHDPAASADEVSRQFGKRPVTLEQMKPTQLLVLASDHAFYHTISPQDLLLRLQPKAVIIDLTHRLDLEWFKAKGFKTWSF